MGLPRGIKGDVAGQGNPEIFSPKFLRSSLPPRASRKQFQSLLVLRIVLPIVRLRPWCSKPWFTSSLSESPISVSSLEHSQLACWAWAFQGHDLLLRGSYTEVSLLSPFPKWEEAAGHQAPNHASSCLTCLLCVSRSRMMQCLRKREKGCRTEVEWGVYTKDPTLWGIFWKNTFCAAPASVLRDSSWWGSGDHIGWWG